VSKTKEIFTVGDLVEKFAGTVCTRGIVLKKRFSPQAVNGQKYNVLTYDILFEDGNIKNLQPVNLKVVQKL
tara:strand:- start:4564 stop:4776 length:213 start_codon:yes stop_codon:yes gene_type:complete